MRVDASVMKFPPDRSDPPPATCPTEQTGTVRYLPPLKSLGPKGCKPIANSTHADSNAVPPGIANRTSNGSAHHSCRFVRVPGGWRPRVWCLNTLDPEPGSEEKTVGWLLKPPVPSTSESCLPEHIECASNRDRGSHIRSKRKRNRKETFTAGMQRHWVSRLRSGDYRRQKNVRFHATTTRSLGFAGSRLNSSKSLDNLLSMSEAAVAAAAQRRPEGCNISFVINVHRAESDNSFPSSDLECDEEAQDELGEVFGLKPKTPTICDPLGRITSRRASLLGKSRKGSLGEIQAGLPHLLAEVSMKYAVASCKQNPGDPPVEKAIIYQKALLASPEVRDQAATCGINAGMLEDMACLFCQMDAATSGTQHIKDLMYFFRRLGICLDPSALMKSLEMNLDFDAAGGLFDFLDFAEVVGHQQQNANGALNRVYGELVQTGSQASLHEFGDMCKEFLTFQPQMWQLKQVVKDLELGNGRTDKIEIRDETQIEMMFLKLRRLEMHRFSEHAGFSNVEADIILGLFEKYTHTSGLVSMNALPRLIREARQHQWWKTSDETGILEFVGRGSECISFANLLHLIRRVRDSNNLEGIRLENQAAHTFDLSRDDMQALRDFFSELKEEEAESHKSKYRRVRLSSSNSTFCSGRDGYLTYAYLAKVARTCLAILGGGSVMAADLEGELEALFRKHASPCKPRLSDRTPPVDAALVSRSGGAGRVGKRTSVVQFSLQELSGHEIESLHLTFPAFISVLGALWDDDFGGISSTCRSRWTSEATGMVFIALLCLQRVSLVTVPKRSIRSIVE